MRVPNGGFSWNEGVRRMTYSTQQSSKWNEKTSSLLPPLCSRDIAANDITIPRQTTYTVLLNFPCILCTSLSLLHQQCRLREEKHWTTCKKHERSLQKVGWNYKNCQ